MGFNPADHSGRCGVVQSIRTIQMFLSTVLKKMVICTSHIWKMMKKWNFEHGGLTVKFGYIRILFGISYNI